MKKGERGGGGCRPAFRQLTCRSLRAPPRRPARPLPRPGLQFGCSGLSDRGLGLRLRSRPGSGTGAPGSGARGSGGGPGAATAACPSPDFSSNFTQPIILEPLRGTASPGPSQTPRPETVSPTQEGGEASPRPARLRSPAPFLSPAPSFPGAPAGRPPPRPAPPRGRDPRAEAGEALRVLISTISPFEIPDMAPFPGGLFTWSPGCQSSCPGAKWSSFNLAAQLPRIGTPHSVPSLHLQAFGRLRARTGAAQFEGGRRSLTPAAASRLGLWTLVVA